jgi:hypothetical protein
MEYGTASKAEEEEENDGRAGLDVIIQYKTTQIE